MTHKERVQTPGALRIAILGAESTGKTALAQALAQRIHSLTGLRTRCVGEWLREPTMNAQLGDL